MSGVFNRVIDASKRLSFTSPFTRIPSRANSPNDDSKSRTIVTGTGRKNRSFLPIRGQPSTNDATNDIPNDIPNDNRINDNRIVASDSTMMSPVPCSSAGGNVCDRPPQLQFKPIDPPLNNDNNSRKGDKDIDVAPTGPLPNRGAATRPTPTAPTGPKHGFTVADAPELDNVTMLPSSGEVFVYTTGGKAGECAGPFPPLGSKCAPQKKAAVHIIINDQPPCGLGPSFPRASLNDEPAFGVVDRAIARLPNGHDNHMMKLKDAGRLIRIGTHIYQCFPLHVTSIDDASALDGTAPSWRTIMKPHPHTRGLVHLQDFTLVKEKTDDAACVVDGHLCGTEARHVSKSFAGAWAAMAGFGYPRGAGPADRVFDCGASQRTG